MPEHFLQYILYIYIHIEKRKNKKLNGKGPFFPCEKEKSANFYLISAYM